ncbi:MAG: hypothetical protein LBJ00_16570 [Planctomycetaceae bacterium]|nr:hypothetical protein [Planctomycetaceae bacterium]
MNNCSTLLRLPNALRCRFIAASEILKWLQYNYAVLVYRSRYWRQASVYFLKLKLCNLNLILRIR